MGIKVNADGSLTYSSILTQYVVNTGSTGLTKSALNSLYKDFNIGDSVLVPAVNLKYTKIDSTNWDEQPLNITA